MLSCSSWKLICQRHMHSLCLRIYKLFRLVKHNTHTHLFIVILASQKIIHNSDSVAELFTQGIQEFVCVLAAWRSGESEEFSSTGLRAGGLI